MKVEEVSALERAVGDKSRSPDFHYYPGIAQFRFGDQPMEMFWHDDISVDHEAVLLARFF